MTSLVLLIARLIVGLGMAAHGSQKAFGWYGGHGLKATGGFFESLGFRPGSLFAALASAGEIVGGMLIAAGLFGPAGPALVILVMIVAAGTMHIRNGFFTQNNGVELNAFYIAASLIFAFVGFGSLSLDAAWGESHYFSETVTLWTVAAGIIMGVATLAVRRTSPATGK